MTPNELVRTGPARNKLLKPEDCVFNLWEAGILAHWAKSYGLEWSTGGFVTEDSVRTFMFNNAKNCCMIGVGTLGALNAGRVVASMIVRPGREEALEEVREAISHGWELCLVDRSTIAPERPPPMRGMEF